MLGRIPLPAIVALGVLMLAPTLAMDFYADDYVHQLVLRGGEGADEVPMRPWALYDFGTLEDWGEVTVGSVPWWTGEGWRARFFRPVSSLLLWGGHAVFGERPLGYHLVGLGLLASVLVAVHGLYRALGLSEGAARVGTLLVALSDSAAVPAGWPANQNTLLVALFAVLSLRVLASEVLNPGRIALGIALAAAAALSKESGVMAPAMAAAFLAWRGRRLGAASAAGLAIGYALFLVAEGYGTRSLFYATPWSDTSRFAGNLAVLLTGGLASLVGPFPLDLAMLMPATRPALAIVGALIGPPLAFWIGRTVRGSPGTGWLAAWTLAFLVVQAGGPPSERLLYVPTLGAAGLLAIFFERRRGLAPRLLLLWATLGSGAFLLLQGVGLTLGAAHVRDKGVETEVGSPALGHRELLVLQSESQMQAFTIASLWAFESEDRDVTFRTLQSGNRPVRWTRVDATTFDLETLGRPFLTGPFERVYLVEEPAFEVGHTWSTSLFEVEALEVRAGHPVKLRFRLRRDLDGPGIGFLRPVAGRLAHIAPPPVGGSIELETPPLSGPWVP